MSAPWEVMIHLGSAPEGKGGAVLPLVTTFQSPPYWPTRKRPLLTCLTVAVSCSWACSNGSFSFMLRETVHFLMEGHPKGQ